jgi:CheY-like chemotaxis protein
MTAAEINSALPGGSEPAPLLLLVDDVVDVAVIVQRLGRRSGHTVVHCARADTAWEYLQSARPDLILLDVNLPGMSGLELCRKIRAVDRLAAVPIAILSSGMLPEDVDNARRAGAGHVLFKDLLTQPEAWCRRLQEILGGLEKMGAGPRARPSEPGSC